MNTDRLHSDEMTSVLANQSFVRRIFKPCRFGRRLVERRIFELVGEV
jgi:hypothetical protein